MQINKAMVSHTLAKSYLSTKYLFLIADIKYIKMNTFKGQRKT